MGIKELWQLSALVTGFTLVALSLAQIKLPSHKKLELPAPVAELVDGSHVDKKCWESWMSGPSFMMWLMRIMIRDLPQTETGRRFDAGTGSLISRRHVLTSCYPVLGFEEPGKLPYVEVMPGLIQYANVKPSGENGTFPWAKLDDGCYSGYRLTVVDTIAPRGCNIDFQVNKKQPFLLNATANNFLVLALAQEVHLKSENSQYMPFDFDIDRNLGLVRWYQSFRTARCVVPRWSATNKYGADTPTQTIEQQGFTYRSYPFEQLCLATLCPKYCSSDSIYKIEGGTKDKCISLCQNSFGKKYHGRLLCLKRMNENIQGQEKYSTVLDLNNVHTDMSERETCDDKWILHGAPVVCNGAVIAIVVQCFEDFLVATTLNTIHHQLFKWGPVF